MDADIELLKQLGGKILQADLTEKIILIGIIWKVIEKKVSEHFKKLEESVATLAVAVADAAKSLGQRLDSAEVRIAKLESEKSKTTNGRNVQ